MNEVLDRGIKKREELIQKYPYMIETNIVLKQVQEVFESMKDGDNDE